MRELLKVLAGQGKAILISSHILTELAEICDGAVFIERGKILRAGTLEQIMHEDVQHRAVVIRALERMDDLHKQLLLMPNVESVRRIDDALEADVAGNEESCCDLLIDLVRQGFRLVEFRPRRAGLEEIFMNVTKGEVQ